MTRVVLALAALLGWAAYARFGRRDGAARLYGCRFDAYPFPTGAAVQGIDLADETSVREWRDTLDCTEEQLRAAIRHVGAAPADVRRHLARRR